MNRSYARPRPSRSFSLYLNCTRTFVNEKDNRGSKCTIFTDLNISKYMNAINTIVSSAFKAFCKKKYLIMASKYLLTHPQYVLKLPNVNAKIYFS